ncbi:GNAT family N-acetyltransferase [Algoriphagus hitonicola]|uniref:Predicted N-acyltransferase, GNAT family n=1 Tax=Algoriphagus hitonicola TaxID=435880 RepID=A0A1I2WA89_9BACT|nr:GNAT family N-acetyltransferase [Algoriphagus hitonicola]SFG98212.1 Predicted N-acyltransferase, GNAT family [Algoriphagus hitonicola]
MSLLVEKVTGNKGFELAFKIRREVFVDEQGVNPEDEYDEFEEESVHFLASKDGIPVGTARWRFTEYGIKLERFAVLKEARGKGVGEALVSAVLRDIMVHPEAQGKKRYLHAQLQAVPLYAKFGFQKVGDMFEECAILHYKMELA